MIDLVGILIFAGMTCAFLWGVLTLIGGLGRFLFQRQLRDAQQFQEFQDWQRANIVGPFRVSSSDDPTKPSDDDGLAGIVENWRRSK